MNQLSSGPVSIVFTSILLFISTSLIFDQYHRGYLFTIRSSNESIFIDRALKRIATCNEQDYPRQKSLLYTFQAWAHLARSNYIRYWLGYRTLQGYLTHDDLTPYDHELDIIILDDDTPLLNNLIDRNYPPIYKLQVHPQWFIKIPSNRSYFLSEGIDFKLQNARFTDQTTNLSINIWPVYINYSSDNSEMLVHNLDVNHSILTPMDWTFPLEPCVFSGIRVWCPAQSRKLINSIYIDGYNYLTCINGSWMKFK